MKKRGAPRCWAALAVVALVVGAASLLARIPEIEVGTTRCRATPRQPLTTARRTTTRDFGKKTLGPVPLLLNARFDGWSGLKPQQIMYQVTIKLARPEMPSSMPGDVRSLMRSSWSADPDARPNFAEIVRELRTTTPKRPASTSENHPWSSLSVSADAGDTRQGSMRSVLSRALSDFRSASSQDVGGNENDDDAPAAQKAPAAVQVPGPSTAPANSSSRAKGRAPVAKRTAPAKAPVTAARADKAGSNWFRKPAKKAAKKAAKASQPDLEAQTSAARAPPPPKTVLEAQTAPAPATRGKPLATTVLEAQTSAAPAPATQAKRAGGMSDCFSTRPGTTSDVQAARPTPAQDPTAGDESKAEAIVRSILEEVGADGHISVLAGWKALRTNAAFARAMGFSGQEGEWDRLVLAFGDKEGEVLSFEEFRNVALSAGEDGPAATAVGTQSSAMAKFRAAARATTAFRATADVPPPPPESSGGPPEDLPPPPPSPQSPYYDSNF